MMVKMHMHMQMKPLKACFMKNLPGLRWTSCKGREAAEVT